MKQFSFIFSVFIGLALSVAGAHAELARIKVLIIDGQNNHKWAETTPLLKVILDEAKLFAVAVSTTPPAEPKGPPLAQNATPEQKAAHADAVKIFKAPVRQSSNTTQN